MYYATFLLQISFLLLPIKLDIIYILFISNPHIRFLQIKASIVTTSTHGTSRYYATFLSQISFLSLPITLGIKYKSFISNPHIRFLQIKASRVTRIIELLNDFKVYIEQYFARICNINRAAVGREVDIAN